MDSSGISLKEFLDIALRKKRIIFFLTGSFFLFSFFYALSLPNIYTSSAVLQISSEENQTQLSSFGNQLSSLASFAGIAQIGGSDKTEFALAKLKSREFVKHLISVRDISPEIIAADFFSNETDTLSFDDQYDLSSKKWVRKPSQNKKVIPSILEIHSELNKSFNASLDKDSGFIKLEFSHISPIFAKDFLDLAIKEINNIAKQKDKLESAKALDYLQIELRSTQKKDIIDSINAVIRNQLNKKMLSNIKDDYLLSTIDAPFVPEKKSSPSRALICIFYTLIGTLLGIIIVYLRKIFLST